MIRLSKHQILLIHDQLIAAIRDYHICQSMNDAGAAVMIIRAVKACGPDENGASPLLNSEK